MNRLLSWKGFTPLGRLTYVVYLIHFDFLYVYWAHARKPYYYTTLDHILHYFGVLLMVFLLAFFISVTVEAPFLNLEKLLFSPAQKKTIRNNISYLFYSYLNDKTYFYNLWTEEQQKDIDDFKIPRLKTTISAPYVVNKEANDESDFYYNGEEKKTYLWYKSKI